MVLKRGLMQVQGTSAGDGGSTHGVSRLERFRVGERPVSLLEHAGVVVHRIRKVVCYNTYLGMYCEKPVSSLPDLW